MSTEFGEKSGVSRNSDKNSGKNNGVEVEKEVEKDLKTWGFEFAFLKQLKDGKGDMAKQLMAKYGKIYIATALSLSAVNFAVCFSLVQAGGPDIISLLSKFGVDSLDPATATLGGNLAIAYIFYKVCLHIVGILVTA